MTNTAFQKITLPLEKNLFPELSTSIVFEDVGKGRMGNHLVRVNDGKVPLVRTTTKYNIPAHNFSSHHHLITEAINNTFQKENHEPRLDFNNALIEIYDHRYTKMKYHSDQCLDLDTDSYIALFSCYENPEELSDKMIRKLKVRDKTTDKETEIALSHQSVVLFSMATNTRFLHKIVLEPAPDPGSPALDNRWLGITFRKSKTIIEFRDNLPYFPNGEQLVLANEDQSSEFYKLRGQENRSMEFEYPQLPYTLSMADTLVPLD